MRRTKMLIYQIYQIHANSAIHQLYTKIKVTSSSDLAENNLDSSSNNLSFNLSFIKPSKHSEIVNNPSCSKQNIKLFRNLNVSQQARSKLSGNISKVNSSFNFPMEEIGKVQEELSVSTRQKLSYLRKLLQDLTKQDNSSIKKELDTLYKEIIQEGRKCGNKYSNIDLKIEEIDKKYEIVSRENELLLNIVKDKSDDIDELKNALNLFKKELKDLKNNRKNLLNNVQIKNRTKSIEKVIKNSKIFNKKIESQTILNQVQINSKEKKIVVNEEISDLSSGKFSTPDKNLKFSTTTTNKTYTKNENFEEIIDSSSLGSNGSGNFAKELYYIQPKYNIQSKPPRNIPKIDINSIFNDTIQTINSNLNKGFNISMKSLQTGNEEAQNDLMFLKEKTPKSDESQRNYEEICKYLRKSNNETYEMYDK